MLCGCDNTVGSTHCYCWLALFVAWRHITCSVFQSYNSNDAAIALELDDSGYIHIYALDLHLYQPKAWSTCRVLAYLLTCG